MKDELIAYIISPLATVLDALKKFDSNAKGFLIVVDDADTLLGTLTDGDIRKALIKGYTVHDQVSTVYRTNMKYLTCKNAVSDAIELFKGSTIKFLPIVDENKKFVNLITKQQMHVLVLQDVHTDLAYDFMSLDENIVDYEISQRPWGFYKTTVMNNYYQSKVISVNPKSQLSLQSHKYREEHWIVAHGVGTVVIGESIIEVKCGSSVFIPKGCKHRLTNTDDTKSLIITEVQIGNYFGEDDIIRYEDIYGRVKNGVNMDK